MIHPLRRQAKNVKNLRKGLRELPEEKPLREEIKDNPPPLEPAPKIEQKPLTEPPKVPSLTAENAEFIADKLRTFGKYGQWVVRLLFGSGLGVLAGHGSSEFGGGLLIGSVGVNVLTRVLRAESILKWLAKPSVEDLKMIATLPPEDAAKLRSAIGILADAERGKNPKSAGTKPSSIMAAWLAAGATSQNQNKTTGFKDVVDKWNREHPDQQVHPPVIKEDEHNKVTPTTGPQSSIPSNSKDMMAKARELQDMFHSSGFSSQPSRPTSSEGATGPQSSLKITHRFNPKTGQIEVA